MGISDLINNLFSFQKLSDYILDLTESFVDGPNTALTSLPVRTDSHRQTDRPTTSSLLLNKPPSYMLPPSSAFTPVNHASVAIDTEQPGSVAGSSRDRTESEQPADNVSRLRDVRMCEQPSESAESRLSSLSISTMGETLRGAGDKSQSGQISKEDAQLSPGILKATGNSSKLRKNVSFSDRPDTRVYDLDEHEKVTPSLMCLFWDAR